jgi:hypothetical protein
MVGGKIGAGRPSSAIAGRGASTGQHLPLRDAFCTGGSAPEADARPKRRRQIFSEEASTMNLIRISSYPVLPGHLRLWRTLPNFRLFSAALRLSLAVLPQISPMPVLDQQEHKRVADMQVAREKQAMQIVCRGRPRRQAEKRGAEVLDALAILAAEIDVASRRQTIVERNELERATRSRSANRGYSGLLERQVDYEMIGRRSILNQTARYKYWVLSYWWRRGKFLSCYWRSGEAEQSEGDARARGLTPPGEADPSLRLG